jgi:hypothetical protein
VVGVASFADGKGVYNLLGGPDLWSSGAGTGLRLRFEEAASFKVRAQRLSGNAYGLGGLSG